MNTHRSKQKVPLSPQELLPILIPNLRLWRRKNAPEEGQMRMFQTSRNGFALVITLSLMILLTVIAVGLLTLSSISLRSSSSGSMGAQARANARMSLMLAIGELQRQTGPDTRVTARADILDKDNPPIFGAWKSWEGKDHETGGNFAGRPTSPGNYQSQKKARFLSWLVSGATSALVPETQKANGKVTLVGEGSVGPDAKRQIHLTPSKISGQNQRGAFAWWVGGENTKARIPKPYQPTSDNVARWASQMKSHAVADTEPFRMGKIEEQPELASRLITLNQADLVSTSEAGVTASKEFFHDLSAYSTGLLTNTATGGWRKDLSLLTETWISQPSTGLPLFRVAPGEDISYNRPTVSNPTQAKSLFYPWAAYGNKGNEPVKKLGAVTSWNSLADYATLYRDNAITAPPALRPAFGFASTTPAATFNYLHKVRIVPVVARVQWVYSHFAKPKGSQYEVALVLTPVITMWNPYNVPTTSPANGIHFLIYRPMPARLSYNGADGTYFTLMKSSNGGVDLSSETHDYRINGAVNLQPGETRVFSPKNPLPTDKNDIELDRGYRPGGGFMYFVKTPSGGGRLTVSKNYMITVHAKFDTAYDYKDGAGDVVGASLIINADAKKISADNQLMEYNMAYDPSVANSLFKLNGSMATASAQQASIVPVPFLSTIFGARMARDSHQPAKGTLQSSPFVNYTVMGKRDKPLVGCHYGGTYHPVNSSFDFSFKPHSDGGGSDLPSAGADGRGFVVTGAQPSDGLSRCIISELPTRPLQSLVELQHWDLRYDNPVPPFAINLIGNSSATPLLPADAVVNGNADNLNLQHDDSYCANHLLFDDWFFSSIAPDVATLGGNVRSIKEVFTSFITDADKSPLANRAYRPIAQDAATPTKAEAIYKDFVEPLASWRTIASRFEVEGMFNVNSTSVTAWRALLGHARNQKVPYMDRTGTKLSSKSDYAVSRFSIAGDSRVGTSGSSGLPNGTEFTGYRLLDDQTLDELASKIVDQVRKRGPFLSLAEFVNRQLSAGDLALAGTIQSALDEIEKNNTSSPYSGIKAAPGVEDVLAVPLESASAEYKFPDAAVGSTAFGLPGWIRQADILRPIAPVLSSRDDTFTIRAYGDARSASGEILAKAVCEAVVHRVRDFVDPLDEPDSTAAPTRPQNQTFGRRYNMLAFRWLSSAEF